MDSELLAAHIFAEAVAAQIEMYGMVAQNERCKNHGVGPTYVEDDFNRLRDRMENAVAGHYRR